MAKSIRSEALILRRFRQGETSLVVHAFTRECGRVAFIARGARAGGKRASVPLIPAVLLELIWTPSTRSEVQLLREVSLVDGFGAIHSGLTQLAWAQAGIEVLARTLTGEQAHEELFDRSVAYLRAVNDSSISSTSLFHHFRLTVLRELGFEIHFDIPESAGSVVRFDPSLGGLTDSGASGGQGIQVHLGAWKLLRIIARGDLQEMGRLRISHNADREIQQVLDVAYRQAFDSWKPLESLKLIEKSPEKR